MKSLIFTILILCSLTFSVNAQNSNVDPKKSSKTSVGNQYQEETQAIKSSDSLSFRILKPFVFFTGVLQMVGFVALAVFMMYEFFSFLIEDDKAKVEKDDRKKGKAPLIVADNLPKLKPINCQNCGAGIPLQENEMICPNCGTKSKAPENYFDVAHAREAINSKIRDAATYLKSADWLSSHWVRVAIGLSVIWLIFSLTMFFVFSYQKDFEPYQTLLNTNSTVKRLKTFGLFAWLFWIISLSLGFLSWSPRVRKTLPTIEFNENLGTSETANCLQCGGTISYQSNDLATVCGYCGVETYRAKLAWKLKNLTNSAHEKANFSLIEAKKYVEDAILEIWFTPKILMCLLMFVAILVGFAKLTNG